MSTLVKTKRRIASISNTRKITNAMELVASVKLKRFKNVMQNGINYVSAIKSIIEILEANIKDDDELEIKMNKTSKRLFIIVNSNLGLCASYNNDIFKFASGLITKNDEIIPIGLKGYTHFKNLEFILNEKYVELNQQINFDDVNKLTNFILDEFNHQKYCEVYIIYMEYINSITYKAKVESLLPFHINQNRPIDLLPPEIIPDAKTLLKELSTIYLASNIYQAILASQVSEQASRNNAMKTATDNADELLEKLKLEYNKARQGAITQEITEVVAGSNN